MSATPLAAITAVTFHSDKTAIADLQATARGRRRGKRRPAHDLVRALAYTAPTHRKDTP